MNVTKITNYLYLIPILVCIIFVVLFVEMEEKFNQEALDAIVEEKHSFFEKLTELAPLFQMEDQFFHDLLDGKLTKEDIDQHALLPYAEVVSKIINAEYTFAVLSVDSVELVSRYPQLTEISFQKDTIISYYEKGVGYNRLFFYVMGEDDYWLFGVNDGNMVDTQNKEMAILITILLLVTLFLNLALVYFLKRKELEVFGTNNNEKEEG